MAWRLVISSEHVVIAGGDGRMGGCVGAQTQSQQCGDEEWQDEGSPGNTGQARRGDHESLAFPSLLCPARWPGFFEAS